MKHEPQINPETQSVLIVTEDAAFARDLMAHWQAELRVPQFTTLTSELSETADASGYDLAILGGIRAENLARALLMVAPTMALAIVPTGVSPRQVRFEFPNVLPLRWTDTAVETAAVIGAELLARSATERKLSHAVQAANNCRAHATLGRYMLDSRHGFNNALTSLLGTAELMRLSEEQWPEEFRDQVETIHLMALRLHGIMQRFSSLETEMNFVERQPMSSANLRPMGLALEMSGKQR